MPYIHTRVNIPVTREKEKSLAKRFGRAIELLPGKSENWLMLDIEGECTMYFKGASNKKLAYVSVNLFGKSSPSAYDKLTAAITEALSLELGVDPDCVYVQYSETEHWGWNGNNF